MTNDCARAQLAFPSIVERVTGARVGVAPSGALLAAGPATVRVEVGDVELFGVAGLRSTGVRAAADLGGALLSASLCQVAAPVGSQARATLEVGYARRGAWQGAARVGFERVALDGVPAEDGPLAGAISRVDVGRVAVIADAELLSGERMRATSVSSTVLVRAGVATLVASICIEDERLSGAGVAVGARLDSRLAVVAGYDDVAQTMRAGAVVSWGGVEVAAGCFLHAVLGASQGVSVAWTR
jgi:hypothetical protein